MTVQLSDANESIVLVDKTCYTLAGMPDTCVRIRIIP